MNGVTVRPRAGGSTLVLAALVLVEGALFVPHLAGWALFIGDSDRLNTFLNMRKFEVENLQAGGLRAWNEYQFMGMSVWGLPYMLPDPLTFLEALFPISWLFFVAGLVAGLLVIAAALSAYLLIADLVADRVAAAIGAALFPLSTYGVLRIGQVDSAFLIFVLSPLGLWLLRKVDQRSGLRWPFLGLTAVAASLFTFAFLQEVAYAMLLLGAFALYRAASQRSWRAPLVFAAAVTVGTLLAAPRLVTVFEDLRQLDRERIPWVPNKREIFRLFYDGIFGRYHEEARAFGNGINLHEGLLLYTSTFAALLVVLGMIRFRHRWFGLFSEEDGDVRFHAWCVVVVLAVVFTPWGQRTIDVAFFKAGFLHARLSLAALLSLCVLVATIVGDLRTRAGMPVGWLAAMAFGAAGAGIALGLTFADGLMASLARGLRVRSVALGGRFAIPPAEFVRLLVAVAVFTGVVLAIEGAQRRPRLRAGILAGLGVLIVIHAFSYAWFKLYGDYAWSFPVPFKQNNFFTLAPAQLRLPSARAVTAFHERLETQHFRTSLVCDPSHYAVFCASHIAQFWRLRLVDGYVPGVPARLAVLPWPNGVRTLRAISFPTTDHLPWRLLGLLNVKYAVNVNDALYFNVVALAAGRRREALPEDVEIKENPAPVAPREFFPKEAIPVATTTEAVRRVEAAHLTGARADPTGQAFVEGLGASISTAAGAVSARYSQDRVDISVDPSPIPRFLVVNDLYHPWWKAFAAGREIPVHPTNVVMRGVRVPPGVATIELRFVPFIVTRAAKVLFVGGACAVVGAFWALARVESA